MGEIVDASNINYYRVIKGKVVTRVSEDHPEAVKREWEDSSGNKGVSYERQVKGYKGKIVDIFLRDTDYGVTLETVFEDDGDKLAQFAVKFDSRLGTTILSRLKNINFNHEVTYTAFWDDKKERSVMAIFQDGKAVQPYFTKDGPHKTPEWKYNEIKKNWDNTEFLDFTQKMLVSEIQPILGVNQLLRSSTQYNKIAQEDSPEMPQKELYEEVPDNIGPDEDDLPF